MNRSLHIVRGAFAILLFALFGMSMLVTARPMAAQEPFVVTPTPTATPVPPPPAPVLLAPINGATTTILNAPPLAMPSLFWQAPAGSNIYHFQISDSSGFASILKESDTYATSYTPADVWQDGEYFWRVRAGVKVGSKTPVWGDYSQPASFQKNWSSDPSNQPLPISPPEGAERSAFTADDFSWTTSMGAAGYKLEIATDNQFANVVYSAETVKPHHTPTQRLAANDTYYWRVTPFAYHINVSTRVNGTASPTATFKFAWSTPPQLIAPQALVNGNPPELLFVPRFSWTAVESAKEYVLQLSTDNSFATSVTAYTTRNTDFTPTNALANDKEYFWHVKAVNYDGYSTAWSETRSFRAEWILKPQLLTPANNQIMLSYAFFSWTPVAGAERYNILVTDGSNTVVDKTVYNVTHFTQDFATGLKASHDRDFFWQVRGVDARGNYSPWSDKWSFRMSLQTSPQPIYPVYYYLPDRQNTPVSKEPAFSSNVVFVWDTAHSAETAAFVTAPDYYVLEAANNPAFSAPLFTVTTTGLAAAPTLANPITFLSDGQMVYWRVRAYQGGAQIGGTIVAQARYRPDAPDRIPATATITPIFPRDGYQVVEAAPVLGWQPVTGAANYAVQVSRRPDFAAGSIVDSAQPQFVNYVPWQGQSTIMPGGAYWWRVRAESSPGVAQGDWSPPRRFDISRDVIAGNPIDLLLKHTNILSPTASYDPAVTLMDTSVSDTGDQFDVDELHVMLDREYATRNYLWYIAFGVPASTVNDVRYIVYVDADHVAGSGATTDPTGQPLTFQNHLLPEYAIHIVRNGDAILSAAYYLWQGGAWAPSQPVSSVGGSATVETEYKYAVHLRLPYTAFGAASDAFSGSLGVAVLSINPSLPTLIADSIPQQGAIYGASAQVDNMVGISDMLTPLYPFDTPLTNPFEFQDMPPLRWRMPYFDSLDGYQVQVAKDANFSQVIKEWDVFEGQSGPYFGFLPATFASEAAMEDNESYYWRVRIRHEKYTPMGDFDFGPWSPSLRIKLGSRLPGNPTLSTGSQAFMTPTFLWERVEGAGGYTVQVDNDANFSSPLINQALDGTSYTPQEMISASLLPGTQYYWRVAMRRASNVFGQWTPTMTFQKSSVSPTPILPTQSMSVTGQPTFQWSVVLTPTDTPRLAAPRYHLQVDDDPTFGSPWIDVKTTANSYTPIKSKSLGDGVWYWRVALYDANSNDGPFSPTITFSKQYGIPALLEPDNGGTQGDVPTFTWEPLAGAAYYQLVYANNGAFTNATKSTTVNTIVTPVGALTNGRYYWYVQMFDQDKNGGPIVARFFDLGYTTYMPIVVKPEPVPTVEAIVFDYYRSEGCTGASIYAGVTPQRAASPIMGVGLTLRVLNAEGKSLTLVGIGPDGQTPSHTETMASNDEELYLVYSNEYQGGESCVSPLITGDHTFRVDIAGVQRAAAVFTVEGSAAASDAALPAAQISIRPK